MADCWSADADRIHGAMDLAVVVRKGCVILAGQFGDLRAMIAYSGDIDLVS